MKKSIVSESTVWLVVILASMWTLTHLTGCNTVKGVGEDVESAGEGVQGAAEGAQNH
jgi:predicted small secreted protein